MHKARPKRSLRRYGTIGSAIDTLRENRIAFLDPSKWDDRNDAEFMRLYKMKSKCPSLKALCCTQSAETYHHWKVFTNSADGCFIEIDKSAFLSHVKTKDCYRYGEMDYVLLDEIKISDYDYTSLPFLKRAGFRPEEEFRVIFTGECDEDAHFMEIEPQWIKKIVLNPWLPQPIAQSIITTLNELSSNPELVVKCSRLTNSKTWADWGKRLSRKKG